MSARKIHTDVAIIGSGMGGSSFAWALRNSGLKVLVLERGQHLPREPQNSDPAQMHLKGRYRTAEPWIDGRTGKEFYPGNYYWVGGNTKVFGASLPRFRLSDFDDKQLGDGLSPKWPYSYDDLEEHYTQAEQLFEVRGDGTEDPTEPPRSKPYPFPALHHEPTIERFAERLQDQGLHPFHSPNGMAVENPLARRQSRFSDGAPDEHGHKADAESHALNPAIELGNVSLETGAYVYRLEHNGRSIARAHCVINGEEVVVIADQFVLAAGAVNSAALLLKSKSTDFPDGLANSSGLVGRNYMVHNSTFMVALNPLRRNHTLWQKTLAFNDWYDQLPDGTLPLGNVQMLGKLQGAMVKGARAWAPIWLLDQVLKHSLDLYLTTEDVPDPDNRVSVEAERIIIHWQPNNVDSHRELVRRTKAAVRKAGYPIVLTEQMGIATNSHQCGTAVAGTDPKSSVLNEYCRSHDLDNLWIVDSSFFPSSAALNPALTISANALRVAKHWEQSVL